MSGCDSFGKTICSICYEDLKPLVEDLQAISICGHVFHELCLQQWLEYCNAKKSTCPVCKQKCCQENVSRLYFQSVGDPTDLIPTQKLSTRGEEEDPSVLRKEVKKLEGKFSALNTAFERQQQDLKELNEELGVCKENAKKEAKLKNEALQQKLHIHQMLQSKSEELVQTNFDCSRLQERNLALAKELAALKLVSDLNLEEDEVVKLASFGHGKNSTDTIDVLKKSLVLRNKSYKELMAQCNVLGRGETRSVKKLEKAKEKMKKLKARVQELEMALEEKDNEVLRALKASKKTSHKRVDLNGVKSIPSIPLINKCSTEDQMTQSVAPMTYKNQCGGSTWSFDFNKDFGANTCRKDTDRIDTDTGKDFSFMANENASELQSAVREHSSPSLNPQTNANCSEDITILKSFSRPITASNSNARASLHRQGSSFGLPGSSTGSRKDIGNISVGAMEEDVIEVSPPSSAVETVLLDDIKEDPPLLHIRKESAYHVSTSRSGDQCFAGGLVGPDGGNRYLGKWCKRPQTDTSMSSPTTMQGSSTSIGELISVGADGRGGRIKILKTEKQSDSKVSSSSTLSKRCKFGAKQSGQQSQGCLQIEHFFGKANRS